MKRVMVVVVCLVMLLPSPAMAQQPCVTDESGLRCIRDGPPAGAPPDLWMQNCPWDWSWDTYYEGWWVYDGCAGLWRWYGNP